jgi:hypothetical protein
VSSPVEPPFGPLTLVGLLILLYIVIQLIHVLIIIGPRPEAPLPDGGDRSSTSCLAGSFPASMSSSVTWWTAWTSTLIPGLYPTGLSALHRELGKLPRPAP